MLYIQPIGLAPSVAYVIHLAKNLILKWRGIIEKISYERVYQSVNDKNLF